ncbi:hypothetical protein AAG596_11580 [Citromicrobium bathyomarinum]|tara:strand:+ start:1013 stop:1252 length:240 start_codon:yes stop_codon:yes gene_type:complete
MAGHDRYVDSSIPYADIGTIIHGASPQIDFCSEPLNQNRKPGEVVYVNQSKMIDIVELRSERYHHGSWALLTVVASSDA